MPMRRFPGNTGCLFSPAALPVSIALMGCALIAGCGGGSGSSMLPPPPTTTTVPGIPAGAILGYIWSAGDGTLRPMLGVSGSAQVGQSIVSAGAYVAGAASATSSLGLVEDETGSLFLLHLPLASATRIAAAPPRAQIVFSPLGNVAIAYAPGGSGVTVISGLPAQPRAATVNLPGGVKLASAAVSDAGTLLVATQANPVAIGAISSAGQYSQLTTVTQSGGMSFLPGAEDALVADHTKNTAFLIRSVSAAAGVQALSASAINQPVAVAASGDRRWAVVANSGDQGVVWIDLNGGGSSRLKCSCQPTLLSSLAGSEAFRLNETGNGPVWMVDVSGSSPRLLFVPAIH